MGRFLAIGYATLILSFALLLWVLISGPFPSHSFMAIPLLVILGIGLLLPGIALIVRVMGRGRSRERRHATFLGFGMLLVWLVTLFIDALHVVV